jgi:hypothetical protein
MDSEVPVITPSICRMCWYVWVCVHVVVCLCVIVFIYTMLLNNKICCHNFVPNIFFCLAEPPCIYCQNYVPSPSSVSILLPMKKKSLFYLVQWCKDEFKYNAKSEGLSYCGQYIISLISIPFLFQYIGSQYNHICNGSNDSTVPFNFSDGGISQQQQSMLRGSTHSPPLG